VIWQHLEYVSVGVVILSCLPSNWMGSIVFYREQNQGNLMGWTCDSN